MGASSDQDSEFFASILYQFLLYSRGRKRKAAVIADIANSLHNFPSLLHHGVWSKQKTEVAWNELDKLDKTESKEWLRATIQMIKDQQQEFGNSLPGYHLSND